MLAGWPDPAARSGEPSSSASEAEVCSWSSAGTPGSGVPSAVGTRIEASISSSRPSSHSRSTSDCSTSKTSLVMLPASTWAFSVAGGLSLSTIVAWIPVSAVKGLVKASFTAAPKAPP